MCFICDQQSGFETDISKILQLNKNATLGESANNASNALPLPSRPIKPKVWFPSSYDFDFEKSFTSSDLIGEITNEIKSEFVGKETIYYYIDDSSGVTFSDLLEPSEYTEIFEYLGTLSQKQTLPHYSYEQKFIEDVFQSIDEHIALDFERTYSKDQGNIDIF